jgi:signal transduction histidine kinase
MFSPVAVAGCAINLLVALILVYMRYGRSGRDWLVLFAIAHAASGIAYGLLIPFADSATLTAYLASPLGLAHSFFRLIPVGAALGGMAWLIFGLPGWRIGSAVLAFSSVLVLGLALTVSHYTSFQAVIVIGTLGFVGMAAMAWRGPTVFYRLLGLTWILRGVMGAGLAYASAFSDSQAVFQTIGILNVIFISATGFALCLIELDDARLATEDADRAKTQFIANMSHELRTPLNAIIGFSELLDGRVFEPSGAQTRQYAGMIQGAGRHLLGIINALLDMASIEARRENLHFEIVEVNGLTAAAVDLMGAEAERKGVILRTRGVEQPVEAITDARALRQILLNLVTNAVKFSSPDTVIEVALARDPARDSCRISVRDQGPGIGSEDMRRIFEPFWQAGDTFNRAHGGVGLGLPIAQRLAQALGATLSVESIKGEGSTFAILLPLSAPHAMRALAPAAAPAALKRPMA